MFLSSVICVVACLCCVVSSVAQKKWQRRKIRVLLSVVMKQTGVLFQGQKKNNSKKKATQEGVAAAQSQRVMVSGEMRVPYCGGCSAPSQHDCLIKPSLYSIPAASSGAGIDRIPI